MNMALGKYSRIDGKKSSSYCSTVTIFAFVALGLVGVWMMTSSSVVPVQNIDISSQDNKNEVNEQERVSNNISLRNENGESNKSNPSSENNESNPQQFEDGNGNLAEDAMKAGNLGAGQKGNNNSDENLETSEKVSENATERNQEEKPGNNPVKVSAEEETNSESVNRMETENGEGKVEDTEFNTEYKDFKSGGRGTDSRHDNSHGQGDTEEVLNGKKSDPDKDEKNSDENQDEKKDGDKAYSQTKEVEKDENKEPVQSSETTKMDSQAKDLAPSEAFPSGAESELFNETMTQKVAWSTQAAESRNEKEAQKSPEPNQETGYNWKICNVTAGPDYIPCLDNLQAIRNLPTTKHYEHRERHCPEDPPTCLVLLPEGYQLPIKWPTSRQKVWYRNVPHTKLVEVKGHQNWVKINGDYLTFPGGGTQFKRGALHYIDFIQESMPDIAWGKRARVILDVGCGVASFGGFLFERDVLTMSFAPKDEHEAQVQFALERGIPAISAVMGTKRLPFPGTVFDVVHCARCRVPWHIEGGKLLLELNRLLRPGGFFVWSATPVYPRFPEDPGIWEAMNKLTKSMCWELVQRRKDSLNRVGIAIFQKPTSNECYENRSKNEPPLCQQSDDPNAAWNVPLQTCMHNVPVNASERGSQWPEQWPARVDRPPYWLLSSEVGVYGKAAPEDFTADYQHWKDVVTNSYLERMGINWSNVRNAMDMKAVYGGFAAALRDLKVWVMNVVPIDSPDTLPIIYERGLFGIYHDWCESFSTYPRSYDLLHADHLFSKIKKKCNLVAVVAEVDRILRPEGKLIVRDEIDTVSELQSLLKSMHWVVRFTYFKEKKGLLFIQKTMWRPTEVETITYAIA